MTPEKRSHGTVASAESSTGESAPYWLVQAATGLSSLAAVAAIASPAPSLSKTKKNPAQQEQQKEQQEPQPEEEDPSQDRPETITVDNNKEPPRKKQRRHDEKWHLRYQQLKGYLEEHGHCNVPQKYEENPHLGRWVDKQRHQYKTHSLKPDRLELLNALQFTWGTTKSVSPPETLNARSSESFASTPSCTPLSSLCSSSASSSASTASMSSEEEATTEEDSTPSPAPQKTTILVRNESDTSRESLKLDQQKPQEEDQSQSSRRHAAPKHNAKWMQRYQALKEYKQKEGNCLVPQKDEVYKGLGSWVMNQRKQHKLMRQGKPNSMTPDRLQLLEELDFEFDPHGSLWNTRYSELVIYKDTFGDCMVPYKNEDNPALGLWVDKQRRQYRSHKKGNQSFMTQERIEKLEAIGFCWEPLDAIPARSAARSLSEHVKQVESSMTTTTANTDVTNQQPRQASPQGPDPAITECLQQLQSNQTSPEVMATSNQSSPSLSMVSTRVEVGPIETSIAPPPSTSTSGLYQMGWMEGFSRLEQFHKETGGCNIPVTWCKDKNLIKWVKEQQIQYKLFKQGTPCLLTPERVHLLKSLNFDFEGFTEKQDWEVMYQELLKHIEKYGVSEVPSHTPLGNWVDEQRHAYRKKQLGRPTGMSDERVGKLRHKMHWQPQNHIDWAIKYEALQTFYKMNHRTNVSMEENPELAVWADTQRKQWKLLRQKDPVCLLTMDQYQQLRSLEFDFDPNPEWKKRLDEVKAYRKRTGDRPLVNHPQLRMWLNDQCVEFKLWSERQPSRLTEQEIRTLKKEGLTDELAKQPAAVAPLPPAPTAYKAPQAQQWVPPPHAHHWGSHMAPPAWPPQHGWGYHQQQQHPPAAPPHHAHAWGRPMPPYY